MQDICINKQGVYLMGAFTFLRNIAGGNHPPAIAKLPVAATQTLVVGDLVVLSSGQVAKASASVALPVGVMAQDSSGAAAGTLVEVALLTPYQIWRAVADASASSAALGGKTYDINSDQTVDIGDSSNGSIFIWRTRDSSTDVEVSFAAGAYF